MSCHGVLWSSPAGCLSPAVVCEVAVGHKYGLVYPGLGWIIWRDATHLPGALCRLVLLRKSSRLLASRVSPAISCSHPAVGCTTCLPAPAPAPAPALHFTAACRLGATA
jgi:hypothetical protein